MTKKIPKSNALIRRASKSERTITLAGARVMSSVEKAVGRYGLMAISTIEDAFQGIGVPRVSEVIDIGEQLQQVLYDAGLDDALAEFRRNFTPVRRAAVEYFNEFGYKPTLAGLDMTSLTSAAQLYERKFLDLFDQRLVNPLADQVINGVIGASDRESVMTNIRDFMTSNNIITRAGVAFTDPQLETLVHDAYRRQDRQAKEQQAAKLEMEIVWFQGPEDQITSEQCDFMLNYEAHGVPGMWLIEDFTADNINSLMGARLLKENPLVVGGHWNCRHNINYVTRDFARSKGWED